MKPKERVCLRKLIKWLPIEPNMNKLSVCMIVKNEEQHLKQCLESIKNLADEIVIVDTGSTDKTKDIAKEYTSKIYDFVWNNDFAEARNFSLSKASGDWILYLDADESISEKDCNEIREILKKPEADAYYFTFRTYTNDSGKANWFSSKEDFYEESKNSNGFWISQVLRLFKKGYLFEGKIHETPLNSIKEKKGIVFDTDIVIHHYGELKDALYQKTKQKNYESLLKLRLSEPHPGKTDHYIMFELASELIKQEKIDEAIIYLEKAIQIYKDLPYLITLGGLYLKKKEYAKAEKILTDASQISPQNEDVLINLGVLYSETKEYNKSIRKFEKAMDINKNSADANYNLGLVYIKMGKLNKSKTYLERAIELNPSYKGRIKSLPK